MEKHTVPCRVVRVVDGDTFVVLSYMGLGVCRLHHLRLEGINAPEIRGPERKKGLLVTSHVKEWVKVKQNRKTLFPLKLVTRETIRGHDKYGRIVGDLLDKDGNSLADYVTVMVKGL